MENLTLSALNLASMSLSDPIQLGILFVTLFAVIVALFGERFWKWYDKPDLHVSFEKDSERCLRVAILTEDDILYDGKFKNVERYYYRLKIENRGGPTNKVRVRVDILESTGGRRGRFEPSTLRWISNKEMEDFAKKETMYVNLCSQVKSHVGTINNRLRVELADLTPRGISWDMPLKNYDFEVIVYGENFNPITKRFKYENPTNPSDAGHLAALVRWS